MQNLLSSVNFETLLTTETLLQLVQGILILVGGYILTRFVGFILRRYLLKPLSDQLRMLIDKLVRYTLMLLIFFFALTSLGIDATPLLGAAGILGVALSFASQASLSNMVSGVFLISEKPFVVGDIIKVGDKTGIVQSIDLLSVKIRTFDNQYIRIPSEKILNAEVTNITRFPIRRQDFKFTLAFDADTDLVTSILEDINAQNIYCLNEPAPLILFTGFGPSGIEVLFGVWFSKTDYVVTRNSVLTMLTQRLLQAGITFQMPKYQIQQVPEPPMP